MKILDSDIIIEFLRSNAKAIEKMQELLGGGQQIGTTVFNAQEILFGVLEEKGKEYTAAKNFLLAIKVLPYTSADVESTISVIQRLQKNGEPIGIVDEIIAGICLSNNATIITRNKKHFSKVDRLVVEGW